MDVWTFGHLHMDILTYGNMGVLIRRMLKLKSLPDIYMHGECHKVQEKHFENHFWSILPLRVALWPPQNQEGPPLWWNQKNCPIVDFNSSKEASWFTEFNKNNFSSVYRFWKNQEKPPKMGIFQKMANFGSFPWFLQKRHFIKSWNFFRCIQCIKTLLLSYQN